MLARAILDSLPHYRDAMALERSVIANAKLHQHIAERRRKFAMKPLRMPLSEMLGHERRLGIAEGSRSHDDSSTMDTRNVDYLTAG